MINRHNTSQETVMSMLLAHGFPIELGIPASTVKELITRKTDRVRPADVLGTSARFRGKSILDEYMDKKGYTFPWGTVAEDAFADEEDGVDMVRFEFCVKDVLLAFPQPALLEDLFGWMYANHPLRSAHFECEDAIGDWFFMAFTAEGQEEIDRLRKWLAEVFIPCVLPDLIEEALRIVDEVRQSALAATAGASFEEALIEAHRFQLCGDPRHLSFCKKN